MMKDVQGVKYRIYKLSEEKEDTKAGFYSGILKFELNFVFSVTFIPSIALGGLKWPPELPEGYDESMVDSINAARYFQSACSNIIVMPDQSRANEIDHVPTDIEAENFSGLIFNVSDVAFTRMQEWMLEAVIGFESCYDLNPFAELKGSLIHNFIMNNILRYVEENLGGENPDWLYKIASRQGLIPIKNL
jgi:hypothetical protein